jgi:uridine kinase
MSIDELNDIVRHGDIDEFIRVCEARQCKALSQVADDIVARRGVRLILLAGPSSSGKTTTAKRLGTQLRVNGAQAVHFSTDDYFVGDARNPRDENGEFDYETIEAVDRDRLAADLNALLRGESVHVRRFDFSRHEGYDAERPLDVPSDGYIILEGIHALNPLLTRDVPDACKFRIYIEPLTQPMVFARTRLDPADARLLRRLVRDNQFRKMPPTETFRLWPKVRAGEAKWIAPFRQHADATLDTALAYELGVLKPYAAGLLATVKRRMPDEPRAQLLLDLLSLVEPIPPVAVPGDSILRETIGASQLDY